ncbi:hypothetical protein AGABI1DRAFT_89840 [Agaricus bisporus var. burnettii JB137-S8]|uniref:Uncharacterized protein n=1 Tax=Agaricus bisporus var. burnettii (strain JB137-S8 / ATCC MYA-4627 / FGSC 10392) TaxID=597362 RepID=K5X5X8_AGABU|nr:uncharacterized protein AGABI1DRAFT_89840 [Agaricus bisporus var. burnettii JB137-S8]EKM83276.1 hypothetical protein AGABI1DRAFT_89840 [Agaricus bisporus var. burnettii JB137-S8]
MSNRVVVRPGWFTSIRSLLRTSNYNLTPRNTELDVLSAHGLPEEKWTGKKLLATTSGNGHTGESDFDLEQARSTCAIVNVPVFFRGGTCWDWNDNLSRDFLKHKTI